MINPFNKNASLLSKAIGSGAAQLLAMMRKRLDCKVSVRVELMDTACTQTGRRRVAVAAKHVTFA